MAAKIKPATATAKMVRVIRGSSLGANLVRREFANPSHTHNPPSILGFHESDRVGI
jgi:hypothetical protein